MPQWDHAEGKSKRSSWKQQGFESRHHPDWFKENYVTLFEAIEKHNNLLQRMLRFQDREICSSANISGHSD